MPMSETPFNLSSESRSRIDALIGRYPTKASAISGPNVRGSGRTRR